jgi:hypothetical protein
VPPFERYRGLLSGFGLLICGGVIGSAVFMSIFQHNFSILKMNNDRLAVENKRLTQDNLALTKFKNRQSVISKVDIHLAGYGNGTAALDKAVELALLDRIRSDLQVVVGQPLSAVTANPQLYQNLIDRKVYYNLYEKDYIVYLKTMLLSPSQLTVWVTVSELIRQ